MAVENPKTRRLVLRRDDRGRVALHDEATGEILSAQAEVTVKQLPFDGTEVIVRFHAHGSAGLRIEVNDDP